VVENGTVTERGTHRELMEKHGYYWQTYCLQYGIDSTEDEPLTASGTGNNLRGEAAEA